MRTLGIACVIVLMTAVAAPSGGAAHTKDHDNVCYYESYESETREGGGRYQHSIRQSCLASQEPGGDVCFLTYSWSHYETSQYGSTGRDGWAGTCLIGTPSGAVRLLRVTAEGMLPDVTDWHEGSP